MFQNMITGHPKINYDGNSIYLLIIYVIHLRVISGSKCTKIGILWIMSAYYV